MPGLGVKSVTKEEKVSCSDEHVTHCLDLLDGHLTPVELDWCMHVWRGSNLLFRNQGCRFDLYKSPGILQNPEILFFPCAVDEEE